MEPFLINNYLSFFAVFEEGLKFLKSDSQDLINNGQASLLICMIVSLIIILISILAVYPLIREFKLKINRLLVIQGRINEKEVESELL